MASGKPSPSSLTGTRSPVASPPMYEGVAPFPTIVKDGEPGRSPEQIPRGEGGPVAQVLSRYHGGELHLLQRLALDPGDRPHGRLSVHVRLRGQAGTASG